MKIPAPVVEVVPLERLQPWVKNPRKNHAVDAIARSIESFGYLAPIVVQKGTYRILAGHGRLQALRAKGVTELPVIVADVDDGRADLYTLADNKLTELADWDFTTMADLLLEFDAKNFDVSLTGFSLEELEKIANWTPKALAMEPDAEAAPLPGQEMPPAAPTASHVRMVSLFLTVDTFEDFKKRVQELEGRYGTHNPTDTVMEALRRACLEAR